MGLTKRQVSYDDLARVVAQQAAAIERLEARVDELEAENAKLRRRLAQDSSNSSKPAVFGFAVP
ncbi:hypothetical protein QMK19_35650 [Streptomyces sp. H10-C2]|uniref:hypothetical protein n=1 Tax=unclassified Streptomyces TaxID=2593676 RepID=UPI0024B9F74E|nr:MULTISPECIES: hypothetical protein [unclassified Streptomyces]MDJ0346430.1 hypothetical protein [Streptomyces sp. PH10-H1]MDJ0374816.1 hypothetical protein [Streptomyces sp. H10-C2]